LLAPAKKKTKIPGIHLRKSSEFYGPSQKISMETLKDFQELSRKLLPRFCQELPGKVLRTPQEIASNPCKISQEVPCKIPGIPCKDGSSFKMT